MRDFVGAGGRPVANRPQVTNRFGMALRAIKSDENPRKGGPGPAVVPHKRQQSGSSLDSSESSSRERK